MTLYEAKQSGKSVRIFLNDSEFSPITGTVDYLVYAKDTDDGRAFAGIGPYEIYEDEIARIEIISS